MRRISNTVLEIDVLELGVEPEFDCFGKRLNKSLIENWATDRVDRLLNLSANAPILHHQRTDLAADWIIKLTFLLPVCMVDHPSLHRYRFLQKVLGNRGINTS